MDDPRALVEQSLHGLMARVLEGHRSSKLEQDLHRAGLDLRAPGPQRLTPAKWKRVMELSARATFPKLSDGRAQHALATRLVEEAALTVWGRALLGVARLLGPRRALERMAQAVGPRSTRVVGGGADHVALWVRHAAVSLSFTEGLLSAGLGAAGADLTELRRTGSAKEGYTYVIRWRGR